MLSEQTPVAQIVLNHSECAPVFQRYKIDYCCKGELPLVRACAERGANVQVVLNELEAAIAARGPAAGLEAKDLTTPALIRHLVQRHHRYLRDVLPFLVPLARKVAPVHGAHSPNLLDVRDLLEELAEAMLPHLDREEQVLFPALLAERGPYDDIIRAELNSMHDDHLAVATILEALRNAAHDFTLPESACTSYTTLYRELSTMEADIFQHVHLENHVLMPRFDDATGERP